MNVQFTTFTKKKNSTARPTSYSKTASCQLKQPCNVRNPVIIVKGSDFSVQYNYAYIASWGYYYFVDDITVTTGDRFEVSLSADVLATYKTQIGSYQCFVERCADSGYYDTMVADNYLSNETAVSNSRITSNSLTNISPSSGLYLLRTVCADGGVTGIASYAMTRSQLADVLSFMFDDGNFTDVITDESVKAFFNPFQYIVDIKWIPYNIDDVTGTTETVKFGWWDSKVAVKLLTDLTGVTFYNASLVFPTNDFSDWRQWNDRFSEYSIFLPGVGSVNLPASELIEGLCVDYHLDIISGDCMIMLYTGARGDAGTHDGVLLSTYNIQLAVPIQIGQLNSVVGNMATNAVGTITSFLSGNIIGGITSAVDTVTSVTQPTPSINGSIGSRYIIAHEPNILISLNNYAPCEYPTTVAGRPCFKNLTLGNLSGYIKCGNASISIPGYSADMEEVNSYLNGGFYYE